MGQEPENAIARSRGAWANQPCSSGRCAKMLAWNDHRAIVAGKGEDVCVS